MTPRTRLDVDLTFHTQNALDTALGEAGAPPRRLPADGRARSGWPILAQLGEYARADLHGLHLTGWIRGHLLADVDHRLHALAQHADGALIGSAEDGTRWIIRLNHGTVTHTTRPEIPDADISTRAARASGETDAGDADEWRRPVGRVELHVTHGLPRIAAVPLIRAHLEELHPLGPEAGGITLTGVATLDADALRAAAPDAAWQAFSNPDTATPNRWTGHHPATGTVEADHVDGQILAPPRADAPRESAGADHRARLDQLLRLLDTPTSAAAAPPAALTATRDPLTDAGTSQEAPGPARSATFTSAR